MKTTIACLTCFERQAEYTAKLATASVAKQQDIIKKTKVLIENFDMNNCPPVNSIQMYNMISKLSGNPDPFLGLKNQGNDQALQMRNKVKTLINSSEIPLYSAIKFAIAGNIIDYGSHQNFDLDKTLNSCLNSEPTINDYKKFEDDLKNTRNILYLADNCGEIVFDGMLIEMLPVQTTMAVKEKVIINDAVLSDAVYCGLDNICQVISNGTNCPGTPLNQCSTEFRQAFQQADMIISKGQGNFETLCNAERPIYFLLTVKCYVVAEQVGLLAGCPGRIKVGDAVFLKKE